MATKLEFARVLDVDTRRYTMTLQTEYSNTRLEAVPFASPYCNNVEGAGATFIPEVGSRAVLLRSGETAIVLGFVMTSGTDSYRGNRPLGNQGDFRFSTRDGSFFIMHRGGLIQLGATPLAQRMYIPLNNVIRDVCQSYRLESLGGEMIWEVESANLENPKALLEVRGREKATDAEPSVYFRVGRRLLTESLLRDGNSGGGTSPEGGPVLFELLIAPAGVRKLVLRADKAGNVFVRAEGQLELEVKGRFSLRVEEDYSCHVLGGYSLGVGRSPTAAAAGSLSEVVSGNTQREAGGVMRDRCASRIIEAEVIQLGSAAAANPAVNGAALVSWLAGHTHPLNQVQLAALELILSRKVLLG